MATLTTEGSADILLEDGATALETEGQVIPLDATWYEPFKLYRATYPDFFPCPTWRFTQRMDGQHLRSQFESGYSRQRKPWQEDAATINMQFIMPTAMYARWYRWMWANGYDWFSIPLDRFDGEKVVYEVRVIADITQQYDSHENVTVDVVAELGATGNLAAPDFGPIVPDEVTPISPTCVPVYIETQPADVMASVGDAVSFSVTVGDDATGTVEYQWYSDNEIMDGETASTLSFTVAEGDLPSYYMVEVSNPCGFSRSTAALLELPRYECDALEKAYIADGMEEIWRGDTSTGTRPTLQAPGLLNPGVYLDAAGSSQYPNSLHILDTCLGGKAWRSHRDDVSAGPGLSSSHLDLMNAQYLSYIAIVKMATIEAGGSRVINSANAFKRNDSGTIYSSYARLSWLNATSSERIYISLGGVTGGASGHGSQYGIDYFNPYQENLIAMTVRKSFTGGGRGLMTVTAWVNGQNQGSRTMYNTSDGTFDYWDYTNTDLSKNFMGVLAGGVTSGYWQYIGWKRAAFTDTQMQSLYQAYLRNFSDFTP